MDELWFQSQMTINEMNQTQFKMIIEQIGFLLQVVEDHELEMVKMAKEIEELKARINNQ